MTNGHPHESSVATLRRRLDRAVAIAHAVRVLGWLGRVACIAALTTLVVVVIGKMITPRGLPAAGLIVGMVTIIAAIVAWYRAAGPAPRRLDVAAATEVAFPRLGERLSRAVDFLAADGRATESRGLEDVAIVEAAEAAAACGRLAIPGFDRHRWWLVAGSTAAIALFMMRPWLPRAAPTPSVTPTATIAEASAHEAEIAEAATSLAACAAIETRLTAVLDMRFVQRPGMHRDELPPSEQDDLDRLAAIHANLIREIEQVTASLEPLTATVPAVRVAGDLLAAIDHPMLESATAAISLHRLAAASETTSRAADVLTAAARALGSGPSARDGDVLSQTASLTPPARRLAAALADIDRRTPHTTNALGATAPAPPREPAPAGPAPAPRADGLAPPDRDAGASGLATTAPATTTEPGFGTGEDAASGSDQDRPAGPVRRMWKLLPARVRPGDERGIEPEVPAAYRQAVDLYYKSLLDTLSAPMPPSSP